LCENFEELFDYLGVRYVCEHFVKSPVLLQCSEYFDALLAGLQQIGSGFNLRMRPCLATAGLLLEMWLVHIRVGASTHAKFFNSFLAIWIRSAYHLPWFSQTKTDLMKKPLTLPHTKNNPLIFLEVIA